MFQSTKIRTSLKILSLILLLISIVFLTIGADYYLDIGDIRSNVSYDIPTLDLIFVLGISLYSLGLSIFSYLISQKK